MPAVPVGLRTAGILPALPMTVIDRRGIVIFPAPVRAVPVADLPIRRGQFLKGCRDAGPNGMTVEAISERVPASREDSTNIAWNHSEFAVPGGLLAAFVQATYRLTDAQMAAIFARAASEPE